MKQYSRANVVEVHGIPVTKNEHVLNVVQDLDKALNVNNTESIVNDVISCEVELAQIVNPLVSVRIFFELTSRTFYRNAM